MLIVETIRKIRLSVHTPLGRPGRRLRKPTTPVLHTEEEPSGYRGLGLYRQGGGNEREPL